MSTLPNGNPPTKRPQPLFHHLITQGLGYCCEWFFFSRYGRTGLIAARLGVSKRLVQYARSRMKNGECSCEHSPNCMKKFVNRPRAIE